jgi:radical SAM superfamily enzyme YgiQ (UPF0313 family)
MNVLLIAPIKLIGLKESKGTIPVPLLHLTSALKREGHRATILDFSVDLSKRYKGVNQEDLTIKILKRQIESARPDLVGINCFTTHHFPFVQEVSEIIKVLEPSLPIMIGGAHPSLFAKEILQNVSTVDYIVIGEGEVQVTGLARGLQNNDKNSIKNISAFAYREEDGLVVVNERQNYIDFLDQLPEPAWDAINLADYYSDHSSWYNPKNLEFHISVPILSSRACPFSCNFCACHATMGRKFRKRSPQKVVDEIQMLHQEKGQNYFGFIDDNVNLDKKHILEICDEIIKRKLNIQYETTCGTHIASLTEEVMDAMAASGCVFVRLPIEHGNDLIRNKIIGKNLPREQIYAVAAYLKKKKIFTASMFIMGFPEDSVASLEDTYNMICELELDLNYVFNIIPFPGTKIFKQAQEDKLFIGEIDFDNLWNGLVNLDPVQDECRFFIKPYQMEIQELLHYRKLFDSVQFFSSNAKSLNQVQNLSV